MTAPALSKRAEKLLARVRAGRWYPAYGRRTPKAMQELLAADLVGTSGRAAMIVACYVPAGYVAREEVFPASSPEGTP